MTHTWDCGCGCVVCVHGMCAVGGCTHQCLSVCTEQVHVCLRSSGVALRSANHVQQYRHSAGLQVQAGWAPITTTWWPEA